MIRKYLSFFQNLSHWDTSLDKIGVGTCSLKDIPVLLRASNKRKQRKLLEQLILKGIKTEELVGGFISCSVSREQLLKWKRSRWTSAPLLRGSSPTFLYNAETPVRTICQPKCEQEAAIDFDSVRKNIREGVPRKYTGNNTLTYILDTGIHHSIPLLKKVSFVGEYGSPPENSHGTLVAQCVLTISDSKIVSLKVLGNDGRGSMLTVLRGLSYCANQTRKKTALINMSLGGPNCCAGNCPICSAVSELAKKGFIIVAAAGNSGKDLCCPGSSKEVMSVGAVCGEKLPTGFSSRGKTAFGRVVPDISSYGVIRFKNNKVHRGTSFSTPIVAGALSLCVSKSKFENYSDVSKLFQRTSEKAIPIKGEHGRSRLLNIKGCIKHRKFKLLSFKNYKQNSFRLLRPIILTTAATTALTALSWWYGFDKLGDVQQQEPTNSSVVLFGRVTSNNRRLYINDGSAIFPLHWAGRSGTRPRIGSISIIFGEITNGDYVSGQKRWTVPWL